MILSLNPIPFEISDERAVHLKLSRLVFALLAFVTAASAAAAEPANPARPIAETVFDHAATPEQLGALLSPAARELKSAAALRGAFTQRKFLRELPQPLVSSGEFLVARGLGVDWHTLKPFDSSVVLTPQALVQRGADGSSKRVTADRQPGLGAVGQVFDALFTLDIGQLAETFTLYGESGAKSAWTLGLVPKEPAFAKVMNRILVTGAAQPNRIVLFEGSGDRTEIEFGAVTALRELAETDRKRFTP